MIATGPCVQDPDVHVVAGGSLPGAYSLPSVALARGAGTSKPI